MDQLPDDLQRALDDLPNDLQRPPGDLLNDLLLDQLPDDVLTSVMMYLDVPSLLRCRLVCRRLGTLALHPDVWRHRECVDSDPWFCAALRLAPRLRAIDMNLPLPEARRRLALATDCPVTYLSLLITDDEDGGIFAQAAQLIRHQSELGQLKGVYLNFFGCIEAPLHAAIASELFGTLMSTPDLAQVSIVNRIPESRFPVDISIPAPQLAIAPSLTYFECVPMSPGLTDLCDLMLTRNAATLESVSIYHSLTLRTPSAMCALGQMPRLEYMVCDTFDGMHAVAACPSLRSLDLTVWHAAGSVTAPEDATELLRSAHQLTKVVLYYTSHDGRDVQLIMALASSGRSRLERLSVTDYGNPDGSLPQLQELLRALPGLPALRKLEVRTETKDLQLDVGPNTAEELRSHLSADTNA